MHAHFFVSRSSDDHSLASATIVLKFLAAAVEVDDHRRGDIFLVLQQDVPRFICV